MRHLKGKITGMLLTAILVLSMTACSFGGTAPVLTVAGKEVILGETNASVFPLTEYELTLPGGGVPIDELPGRSWMTTFLCLEKDRTEYAYVYVYNPKRESVPATLARIYKISFTMHSLESSYWAEDNVLVNGVNFFGMDASAVKEAMSGYKVLSEEDRYMSYKDGNYTYRFKLNGSGIVEEVEVEMGIDKSYD